MGVYRGAKSVEGNKDNFETKGLNVRQSRVRRRRSNLGVSILPSYKCLWTGDLVFPVPFLRNTHKQTPRSDSNTKTGRGTETNEEHENHQQATFSSLGRDEAWAQLYSKPHYITAA